MPTIQESDLSGSADRKPPSTAGTARLHLDSTHLLITEDDMRHPP